MKTKKFQLQEQGFWLLYSVLFLLSAALAFRFFPEAGKRMVWKGDGLSQHYVALCYYARWGRAVLESLLAGQPSFPTLNLHMGLGADLFTTLQYYVIGDPFSLPAVFVPQRYMLDFHDAMIVLRMYLAGLCFERYCRAMGRRDLAGNLAGSLVYVFSTFALFGMRHPYFLNAMLWFPLLLLGAEHIFQGKKGRLFTVAVFLSCISNFYFFYMLVLLTVVYVVWRALRIHLFPALRGRRKAGPGHEDPAGVSTGISAEGTEESEAGAAPADPRKGSVPAALRAVGVLAAKFLYRAALGAAMGAAFLLPILLRFAQDPRVSGGTAQGVLYALSYYAKLPEAFVGFGTDETLEYWTCLGFGALGLVSVLLLFLNGGAETKEAGSFSASGSASAEAFERKGSPEHRSIENEYEDEFRKKQDAPAREAAGTGGEPAERVCRNGSHPDLKIAFLFLLALAALPFGGIMLNGFSYPANRWTWAFAMLAGYIAAVMLPSLPELSGKKTALLLAALAAYAGLCARLGAARSTLAELLLAAAAVLAVRGIGWAKESLKGRRDRQPGAGTESAPGHSRGRQLGLAEGAVLLAAAVLTVAVHAYVEFVPGRMNSGLEGYHTDRYIGAMTASDAAGVRSLVGNDEFYRYSGRDLANNFSLLHDVSNTQYYWSLSDAGIERFFTETGQGNGMVHLYDNLDNRTMTDEIAGVRYYKRSDGALLPYGYERIEGMHYDSRELYPALEEDPVPVFSFSLFENAYALPLGFTSDRYISRQKYEALSIPERQEALMQGVLLEEDGVEEAEAAGSGPAGEGLREADLVFTAGEIPYAARAEEGIEFRREEDGGVQVVVRDTGKALYLEAADPADLGGSEISVLFTGMEYAAESPAAPEEGAQEEPVYENTEPVEITVTAKRDGETVSRKTVSYTLPDNPWKTGRSDFLSCCGYADEPLDTVRLKFSRKGTYTFRSLELVGQPMDAYPAQVEALRAHALKSLDLHELPGSGATSRITGMVTVPDARILCLQIPHLQGLSGYVDGMEQTLLQADTMFCALVLEPGTHEIELRYRTPGLAAGTVISLAAAALFILEMAVQACRRAKELQRNNLHILLA